MNADLLSILKKQQDQIAAAGQFYQEMQVAYDEFSKKTAEIAAKYGLDGPKANLDGPKAKSPKSPSAGREVPATSERGQRTKAIREYLESNPDAKPKAVVEALAGEIKITAALVSAVKNQLKQKAGKTNGKTNTAKPSAKKNPSTKRTLPQVIRKILGLKKNLDGLKHADLCEAVSLSGYKSRSGSKKQFSQVVYQAVHNMRKSKGENPPEVVRDADSRRYRLNPEIKAA
jgi:ribosomal protein S7